MATAAECKACGGDVEYRCRCGSTDLCFGVDEHDVEDGTWVCEACETEGRVADSPLYPYCRMCHHTGRAATDQRADQVARFQAAFPDAEVAVEHTGGGCLWLAFRWERDRKYYVATDGEANLPNLEGVPLEAGGWGYVGRYDDAEDDGNPDFEGTPILQPIVDGEDSYVSDRYWTEYPAHCLSDEQVIEAIRADRALQRPDETPLEHAYRLGEGCGGLDADGVRRLVELDRETAR